MRKGSFRNAIIHLKGGFIEIVSTYIAPTTKCHQLCQLSHQIVRKRLNTSKTPKI